MESIYKSDQNAKLNGLGAETKWSNYKWREVQALFKRDYLDKGRECFMKANIDNQSKLIADTRMFNICRDLNTLVICLTPIGVRMRFLATLVQSMLPQPPAYHLSSTGLVLTFTKLNE